MTRKDGAPAGGNLTRDLLGLGLAVAGVLGSSACQADAGRIVDGQYYSPDTVVQNAEWGIVDIADPLPDGGLAVRTVWCLSSNGGPLRVADLAELRSFADNPEPGTQLVFDGLVTAADGTVFSCSHSFRAADNGRFVVGAVVPVPVVS